MIIHIAKKEVLEHLKSFRFLVAFLFVLATFFIMMFTRHFEYRSKYDEYLFRMKAQEEALDKYAHYNRIGGLYESIVPPSAMEILVDPAVESVDMDSRSLDDDPYGAITINLDIIALIGFLGSLLALLLSYDSVNREAHEGTMRLLLSSGVPRIKIIIGKILGGSMAAVLPIATIFLIVSIWLAVTGSFGSGMNLWMSLLGIFLISIVYIMFFYCVGAFLSSVVLDQTLSVLSCFGVWMLLVIVVPVICPYIARSVAKVPDYADMRRQLNHIYNVERDDAVRQRVRAIMAARNISWQDAFETPEVAALNQTFHEKGAALRENFEKAATWQTKLSIRLSCISPYSMYLMAVEEVSGLGFVRFEHLNNVIGNWNEKAFEYIQHQFNEARKRDPGFTMEHKLDVSGMPRFPYFEPSLSVKYSSALPFMLLLLACFLVPIGLYLITFNSRRRLF
jgi:ABC-type transport system involved in multi-copper enzyme maturation permease subunit